MKLSHYPRTDSPGEWELDRSKTYLQPHAWKPRGFWVSVDGPDDWPTWCRAEDFSVDTLGVRVQVTLADDANLLIVDSPQKLLDLAARYQPTNPWMRDSGFLDWPAVAATYDGIIIAPYQWAFRYSDETSFYYTWDCASGCIWNLEAIATATRQENQPCLTTSP